MLAVSGGQRAASGGGAAATCLRFRRPGHRDGSSGQARSGGCPGELGGGRPRPAVRGADRARRGVALRGAGDDATTAAAPHPGGVGRSVARAVDDAAGVAEHRGHSLDRPDHAGVAGADHRPDSGCAGAGGGDGAAELSARVLGTPHRDPSGPQSPGTLADHGYRRSSDGGSGAARDPVRGDREANRRRTTVRRRADQDDSRVGRSGAGRGRLRAAGVVVGGGHPDLSARFVDGASRPFAAGEGGGAERGMRGAGLRLPHAAGNHGLERRRARGRAGASR